MKVAVGSDHGGAALKAALVRALEADGVTVEDVGCNGSAAVDYPDYAAAVAGRVAGGSVDSGVLICRTGIGMSMAANKFEGVRAALCCTPEMARLARSHNDANVLTLGADSLTAEQAEAILKEWLATSFLGGRHARRVTKMDSAWSESAEIAVLGASDPEVHAAVVGEIERQRSALNLIASENYVSRAVREAQGCVMTNKYAEGYPGRRWYSGCDFVDRAETLAIERARQLYGADHANVQPHCGSSANMAVYFSVLQPGDTILAMNLAHGGHLTHGNPANFSGRLFKIVAYGVSATDELIDYDEVARLAEAHRPKLIVAGASAYPRILDFPRFRAIADAVGALLMVDMAHVAGLVAAGVHPSPVPYAEFVTTTTHKTLRGPRSGLVLCREAFAKELDRQVFPGLQGGPLMHTIAAKAVCFGEALQPSFKAYGAQVVRNAAVLAERLQAGGFRLVSGGTENHLMLVDLTGKGLTGKDAALALDKAGIIVNKNAIPFDKQSPFVTSGIRIGTPSVTSRGMGENEMRFIGDCIDRVLHNTQDAALLQRVRAEVRDFCAGFAVP